MTIEPKNANGRWTGDRRARRRGAPGRHEAGAFTLVEMLAVILVIGILVTIVVGVAGRVISRAAEKRTLLNMESIMNAIQVYQEENGMYPVPDQSGTYLEQNAELYELLKECDPARKRLGQLSDTAYKVFDPDTWFVDGFENPLRYHVTGGAGGAPYLESAGHDGDFSTSDDNIRSDKR